MKIQSDKTKHCRSCGVTLRADICHKLKTFEKPVLFTKEKL